MFRSRIQSGIALTMGLFLLYATSLAHAATPDDLYKSKRDDVSTETILVDGFILRPAGVVATILGSVAFVVTLPFSIPTKSVDKMAQKLVVEPARYTFTRPMGEIESTKPTR